MIWLSMSRYDFHLPAFSGIEDSVLIQVNTRENTHSGIFYTVLCSGSSPTLYWKVFTQFKLMTMHSYVLCPAQTQEVNWTYIRRSEDVPDVFRTSYVRSVYVLFQLGLYSKQDSHHFWCQDSFIWLIWFE